MKSIYRIVLFTAILTGFQCRKDDPVPKTDVSLEFVDSVTGEPLNQVSCYISFYNSETGAGFTNDRVTGPDGKINLEIIDSTYPIWVDAHCTGYGAKSTGFPKLIIGELNRIVISMYRFNCTIRLEVKNNTAQTDSVYIRVENGLLISAGLFSSAQFPYYTPIKVQPSETQTYYVPAISDDPVSMFWSWKPYEWSAELPLKNVLILAENDTLTYTISN